MDGVIEFIGAGESLMRQMMCFEIAPDQFDVIEFGRVFWQPLDGEPMLAGFKRGAARLADVDRPVILDQHDRLHDMSGLGTIECVELLQVSDEIAAPFGRTRMHNEPFCGMVERAEYRDFLGLAGRRHSEICAPPGPGAGQIRVRQRLALVAVEENDVAGLGLGLAQLEAQPDALDFGGNLPTFQRVAGPPPAEVFFRSALDNCDRPILTPSRASISTIKREIVQLVRSATGASRRGATTRNAASLKTGAGPRAMVAL